MLASRTRGVAPVPPSAHDERHNKPCVNGTAAPRPAPAPSRGDREPARYATPSFFCKLVDDVVYWKISRLSG
jgi:hypothetical protein